MDRSIIWSRPPREQCERYSSIRKPSGCAGVSLSPERRRRTDRGLSTGPYRSESQPSANRPPLPQLRMDGHEKHRSRRTAPPGDRAPLAGKVETMQECFSLTPQPHKSRREPLPVRQPTPGGKVFICKGAEIRVVRYGRASPDLQRRHARRGYRADAVERQPLTLLASRNGA